MKRFNSTIKIRICTYLSDRGTVRWVEVIQFLKDAYNHWRYRSICMAPVNYQKKDDDRIWVRPFTNDETHLTPYIFQKDIVQISSHKTLFDKGYMPNWIKEHVTVIQAVPPKTWTKRRVYKFVDYNEEDLNGSWYPKSFRKLQTTNIASRKF